MSWIKRLGGRLPDFEDVVRRFPVAVIVMAIATIWLIVEIHMDDFRSGREYVFGGFIFAGYAAVIGHLIAESRGWTALKSASLALLMAAPAFLFSAFGERLNFNVILGVGAAIVFLGNAAAWRTSRHDPAVWNFTQKLWTGAIFAAVGSGIFAAGMVIISEAVKALFGFNLEDLTINTLLPIGLLFLAPVYWLGTLPRYGEAEDVGELSFEARALSFLGTWMLAPLVIIYALIILAYGAKVLIQWELPKGEIALLVSPFLGVGMLVWLMLEPKVLKESGFVRFYRAAWHWIMLPAAVLLGVGVFARIGEYGFTLERVFLTLIVIWAVVQSLWFIFMPKARRDIRIPTALAAGLLMFGAFAAQPLSTMSQFNRAADAKAELPVFEAQAFRNNPEVAKRFLGGLKYVIEQKDETRFKRLVPKQEMPESTYGTEYDSLIKSLGLSGVEENSRNLYVSYSIKPNNPLEIMGAGQLYGGHTVLMYNETQLKTTSGIFSNSKRLKADLSIAGELYPVNFEEILQQMVMQKNNDFDAVVQFPPISMISKNGQKAALIITGGTISRHGDIYRDGNFEISIFVPN